MKKQFDMPPKKSDAPKLATGDEGTPSRDREGVNVEVCSPVYWALESHHFLDLSPRI